MLQLPVFLTPYRAPAPLCFSPRPSRLKIRLILPARLRIAQTERLIAFLNILLFVYYLNFIYNNAFKATKFKSMQTILYSFRRCPYAMRARLALHYCQIDYQIREISLKNKPQHLLEISPKGTVPVLYLPETKQVIDQSLDIMLYALEQFPEQMWLTNEPAVVKKVHYLIQTNDNEFKFWLDRYKYSDRFPEHDILYYWEKAGAFLTILQNQLQHQPHLGGQTPNMADMAILPFIRQIASVDLPRFTTDYPGLLPWLEAFKESALFKAIMVKHEIWQP